LGELQAAAVGVPKALPTTFEPQWPTSGEITTYYGERGRFSPSGHTGLDVAAPQGTPIRAAADGEVIKAVFATDGYGGLVIIAHPSGYETWYAHLSRFSVKVGERVARGEQIGLMGSTGFSTGPHLHFEVRQDGQLRDPLKFLSESALQRVKAA
jgi:murein DD-endopeptidase MepM/ murein hydrolase activator NlpD